MLIFYQNLSSVVNISLESACTNLLPLVSLDVVFNHKTASSSRCHLHVSVSAVQTVIGRLILSDYNKISDDGMMRVTFLLSTTS